MGVPGGGGGDRRGAGAAAWGAVRAGLRRADGAVGPGTAARAGRAGAAAGEPGRGVAVGRGRTAAGPGRAVPLRRGPHRAGRRGARRGGRRPGAGGGAAGQRRGHQAVARAAAPAAAAARGPGTGAGGGRGRRGLHPARRRALQRVRAAVQLPDLPARPRARGGVAPGAAADARPGIRRRAHAGRVRVRQLPGRRAVGPRDAAGRHPGARRGPARRRGPGLAGAAQRSRPGPPRPGRPADGGRARVRQGAQRAVPAVAGGAGLPVAVPTGLAPAGERRAAGRAAGPDPAGVPAVDPDPDPHDPARTGAAARGPRPAAAGGPRRRRARCVAAGLRTAGWR